MYDEDAVRELVMEWFQVREIVVDVAPEEIMDNHELIRAVTTHINMSLLKTKKAKKEDIYGDKHKVHQKPRNPLSNVPVQSTEEQQEELIALIMSAEEAHKNPQSMVEHAIKTYNVSGIDQLSVQQADSLIKSLKTL